MKKSFLFALGVIVAIQINAQSAKMPPLNQLYKDSPLTKFVCKLQYAIFKKDKNFLISILDTNIKNSFGGDGGIEEFKTMWRLDSADSEIWMYLSKLISLGGVFLKSENEIPESMFVFPYLFGNNHLDSLNVFSVMLITGENVNVRESPDRNSKSLAKLSYDIVNIDYEKSFPPFNSLQVKNLNRCGAKEWYFIQTLDNKVKGFVFWDYIWSPIGYRLFLNKVKGQWKIIFLVEGD